MDNITPEEQGSSLLDDGLLQLMKCPEMEKARECPLRVIQYWDVDKGRTLFMLWDFNQGQYARWRGKELKFLTAGKALDFALEFADMRDFQSHTTASLAWEELMNVLKTE